MYEVLLAKESFKFSAAHLTVFSENSAERLHGHNYYVSVKFEFTNADAKTNLSHDFAPLKSHIQHLCDDWDEYTLLALESPWIQTREIQDTVEMQWTNKTYSFPKSDVRLLPVANITCESLAQLFAERLATSVGSLPNLAGLKVQIEETRGQSVSFTKEITGPA